ncbi:hypothetical protein GXW77_00140 [Roseomonas alkaliterrae]|uniref:Glycosyltransferase RgtA/B/C/D-like domain-containing protein n=2 Tax=Neoroseomonas alkaliterrae TaxID=1452450 RepID=A0A840XZ11_9PROT|nr:DUF6311 domain-containing protein [Neoroseomonas alkaliterrae]MBB5689031.1 hypothetical protein [Neoroseomonas alkaliterrae]MBR0674576.1 hypothetical protein [Neoroseomonas alkaliterrae]
MQASPRMAEVAGTLAAAALGLFVIHVAFGAFILPPGDTGWMLSGRIGPDPVQYWLGWTAFARDSWRWPPGANPGWGMELASSIFYSDSIPLLAFAFKALRPLAEVSQYWGMWIYACGALQAALAWRLMGLATRDSLARLAVAGLFVMQPLLLGRLGGHFALGGQFLLLIGLWLCVTPGEGGRRVFAWGALMAAAAMIQAYLLPMVGALWAADWLARVAEPARRGGWRIAAEALLVPGAGIAGLWAAGFFLLGGGFGGTWGGYGKMQLDLLAPFDPGYWGAILPDIATADHLEAGNSYPGLGALVVLALGALAWMLGPRGGLRRHWALLLILAGLLLLAVTHRVAIGGREFEVLPLPDWLVAKADALRASERFFWPVLYAALFGAAAALVRHLGGRRAGFVLAGALALQVVDLRPGFARLHHYFIVQPPTVPLRLSDPFWLEAARRYDAVRVVPTGMQAPNWEEVAVYAATLRLQTDAVYLARLDPRAVEALNARVAALLERGAHEPRTFYVLGDEAALARARAGMDPERDLLGRFNDRWVLAPGWRVQQAANSSAR